MDIGRPLIEYGPVDFAGLRDRICDLSDDFWDQDSASRNRVAGNRPGRAVFFFNDVPPGVDRNSLFEAESGRVSVLRYRDRALFPAVQELLDTAVGPHFAACDVIRVQLAELPPGGVIPPHRDRNILAVMHRLHVPIVTDDDVRFIIDWQPYALKAGHLYDLNNAMVHSVENRSDIDRIHLLIDVLPHAVARARYFDRLDEMVDALR